MDTTFFAFLRKKLLKTNPRTTHWLEVSEYFPRTEINRLFRQEIDKLRTRDLSQDLQQELEMLSQRDWVGYIDRSLRRAGFQDELDNLVQDLAVKMLVTGNLFTGWRGQSSLQARVLVTIRNAISTLIRRKQASLKRSKEIPIDMPEKSSQGSDSLVDEFKNYLRNELGPVAVTVFDHRLEGGDTKDLIGQQGIETSYRLKKIVQEIKEAAKGFASRDPDFLYMVKKAFENEAKTFKKRFGRAIA